MLFDAGATIWIREVLHGATWLETPATIVADDGDILAITVEPGAPFTFPRHPFGPHPWSGQSSWAGPTVLRLQRAGAHYSVWRFFREGETDGGWYVNFERPMVRNCDGVEVDDWGLDIVIAAEGTWAWKDVDDPARMVASGRLTPAEIRRAAVDLARTLDRRAERWWDAWTGWRPQLSP